MEIYKKLPIDIQDNIDKIIAKERQDKFKYNIIYEINETFFLNKTRQFLYNSITLGNNEDLHIITELIDWFVDYPLKTYYNINCFQYITSDNEILNKPIKYINYFIDNTRQDLYNDDETFFDIFQDIIYHIIDISIENEYDMFNEGSSYNNFINKMVCYINEDDEEDTLIIEDIDDLKYYLTNQLEFLFMRFD